MGPSSDETGHKILEKYGSTRGASSQCRPAEGPLNTAKLPVIVAGRVRNEASCVVSSYLDVEIDHAVIIVALVA